MLRDGGRQQTQKPREGASKRSSGPSSHLAKYFSLLRLVTDHRCSGSGMTADVWLSSSYLIGPARRANRHGDGNIGFDGVGAGATAGADTCELRGKKTLTFNPNPRRKENTATCLLKKKKKRRSMARRVSNRGGTDGPVGKTASGHVQRMEGWRRRYELSSGASQRHYSTEPKYV